MSDPATCSHPEIAVEGHTDRTQLQNGSIGAWRLTISTRCAACGTDFWFPGLPTGVSFMEPVTSTDGFMVTLPMVPNGQRNEPDPTLGSSTIVRTSDIHKGRKRP